MRSFSVFSLLLMLALGLGGSGLPHLCPALPAGEVLTPEQDFQMRKFIYEGSELLAAGETARALARFKSAQKIAPANPDCYYWIALAYSDLQNFGMAAKNAETAVGLNDNQGKNWLLWGQSLLYDGRYEDAVKKLSKAFQLEPENYLAAFNLGRCYYHGFKNDDQHLVTAARFMKKALELNNDYIPARYYLGCIYLDSGQLQLAQTYFNLVISRDPQNVDAHYRLGLAYRKDNHIAQAEREFQEALAIDPAHYESHLQLGHIYLFDKPNREKAIQHFTAFLESAPQDHPRREGVEKLLSRDKGYDDRLRRGAARTTTGN